MHHSQLINHLQAEGKFARSKTRWLSNLPRPLLPRQDGGELDAPRNAIGGVDVEPERR